jgi:hypothetical protein
MCKYNDYDQSSKNFFDGVRCLKSSGFEYEEANDFFKKVVGGDFFFYSVIFRAYINTCVWNFDDDFLGDLSLFKDDPVSLHMMALYYVKENDLGKAKFFNELSIGFLTFPANLILKARFYGSQDRNEILVGVRSLVKNVKGEELAESKNIMLSSIRLYKELILNSYFSSVNWYSLVEELTIYSGGSNSGHR